MNGCVIKFARAISKEYNVSTNDVYDIVMDEYTRVNEYTRMYEHIHRTYEEIIDNCKYWIDDHPFENTVIVPDMITTYSPALLFFGSLKSVKRSV